MLAKPSSQPFDSLRSPFGLPMAVYLPSAVFDPLRFGSPKEKLGWLSFFMLKGTALPLSFIEILRSLQTRSAIRSRSSLISF